MARPKNFLKESILNDATHIFWKNGFHQTSIKDLVQTLGINRASLYGTFLDKENLFIECFLMYREGLVSHFNQIFNKEKTIKNGFKSFFDFLKNSYGEDMEKKGCFMCNSYAELLPTQNKVIKQLLNETREIITSLIVKKLQKAQKEKNIHIEINIDIETQSIYTTMIGTAILSKIEDEKKYLKNTSLYHHLSIFK
tara:strand:- start:543 stop:1130 length:588 start_codon:yes stop_codon:yes gene_type:complete